MPIIVYNRVKETHSYEENNYPVYFGAGILSNPYTDEIEKRRSIYYAKTIEDAMNRYDTYFDVMYKGNMTFKYFIDEIYQKYLNNETIYLEDQFVSLDKSTGSVIKSKIEQMVIKNKLLKYKQNLNLNK